MQEGVCINYVNLPMRGALKRVVEDYSRMSLRVRPEEKALLVLRHAPLAARAVIEEADHLRLSGRDSLRALDLLEHPPAPNAKLRAAARSSPKMASNGESI